MVAYIRRTLPVQLIQMRFPQIKRNVTHIFHVSYPLNFNLGIAAFEPQVAFVHSLVKLALDSRHTEKPRIVFASSASSLQNWDKEDWVPEEKVKVGTAVGTGYGESKRACELVRRYPSLFLVTCSLIVIAGPGVCCRVTWAQGCHCADRPTLRVQDVGRLECHGLGTHHCRVMSRARVSSRF